MTIKYDLDKKLPYKISYQFESLHLSNTILWFDSRPSYKEGLSFLSSAMSYSSLKHANIITTEETVKILDARRKKVDALICPYNKPFSIGKLRMELLPSGSMLGGASLFLETDYGRVLYAPQLQTNKNPTVRQMQLKKAQTLILSTPHPDPNVVFPSRKKEKERLLETIKVLIDNKITPIVLVNPLGIAQELTKTITDAGFSVIVHSSIWSINKIYESYNISLGNYKLYDYYKYKQSSPSSSVLLFPLYHQTWKLKKPLPLGKLLSIEDTAYPSFGPDFFHEIKDRFYISLVSDCKELKEVISAIAPKEIYFIGPYAKKYSEKFKNFAKDVKPLYPNNQLTLL